MFSERCPLPFRGTKPKSPLLITTQGWFYNPCLGLEANDLQFPDSKGFQGLKGFFSGTHGGCKPPAGQAAMRSKCLLVAQSCLTLCDPTDCSSPGSTVHGILQARTLEWVAILFSKRIFLTQGSNPGLPHCRWREPPGKPLSFKVRREHAL